jgi:outer membrane protein assembly factor BamB
VKVRVRARDAFGNEAVLDDAPEFPVTRLRWAYDAGAPVTAAAVTGSGDGIVGVSATNGNLRRIQRDGVALWSNTVTTSGRTSGSFVTSAPSLGANTVWVGSDDGKLYGFSESDGVTFGCPATAVVGSMFTPAVLASTTELAFSAGGASALYGGGSDRKCLGAAGVSTTDPATTALALTGGKLFLPTSRAARSTLRRYSTALAEEVSAATGCGTVFAPPAVDQNGHILLSCAGGEIVRCDRSTLAPTTLVTLGDYAAESVVVFAGGDLLVGTNDRKLHRLTPPSSGSGSWADAWSSLPALSSSVRGVLVAEQDRDGVVAYAVTGDGQLYALAADGQARWSTTGEASAPLGISPLTFPTIAPAASASQLPTLYAGSDDGHLYAVVVDSALDPRSPWPKSHHDARNSGDADAPVYP